MIDKGTPKFLLFFNTIFLVYDLLRYFLIIILYVYRYLSISICKYYIYKILGK